MEGSEHKRAWRDLREREKGARIFIFKSLWMDEVCPEGITSFGFLVCVGMFPPMETKHIRNLMTLDLNFILTADNDFMATLTRFNVVVVVVSFWLLGPTIRFSCHKFTGKKRNKRFNQIL